MNKKDLEKLIAEKTKKAEKEHRKQVTIVIAVSAAIYFFMFCLFEGTPDDFNGVFTFLLSSFMISAVNCCIYEAVFEHIFAKDEAARNEIKELKQTEKLKEAEETIKHLERKIQCAEKVIEMYAPDFFKGGVAEKYQPQSARNNTKGE